MASTNFLLLMILFVLVGRSSRERERDWSTGTWAATPPKPLIDRLLLLMPFVGIGLVTLIVLARANS
jgi:hypothetical protein